MMFIYFWEQVWTFGLADAVRHNFETEEVSKRYCEQYHYADRGKYYPTENMVKDDDYLEY